MGHWADVHIPKPRLFKELPIRSGDRTHGVIALKGVQQCYSRARNVRGIDRLTQPTIWHVFPGLRVSVANTYWQLAEPGELGDYLSDARSGQKLGRRTTVTGVAGSMVVD